MTLLVKTVDNGLMCLYPIEIDLKSKVIECLEISISTM